MSKVMALCTAKQSEATCSHQSPQKDSVSQMATHHEPIFLIVPIRSFVVKKLCEGKRISALHNFSLSHSVVVHFSASASLEDEHQRWLSRSSVKHSKAKESFSRY